MHFDHWVGGVKAVLLQRLCQARHFGPGIPLLHPAAIIADRKDNASRRAFVCRQIGVQRLDAPHQTVCNQMI
jgi:hypothetical protein